MSDPTRTGSVKTGPEGFAVLGGGPAFLHPLHVGRPNVGDRERFRARIDGVLSRGWLTNDGPLVKEFEQRIIDLAGVKHCVAMCNGTVALEIAIRALGFKDEVILPSFTFIATAHALQWQQITPVFCDIDPATHNIDPARVERLITPRTSGIIGLHAWGRPCYRDELLAIARRHRLPLLFDAAHAFGCSHRGSPVGGTGEAEVFSFHATKLINCFEGGAVVTNDDDLAGRMRLMRNFGFVRHDEVVYLGTNGKMSEASAAMGLTSLDSMEEFVAANERNYHAYLRHLEDVAGVRLLRFDESERCNFQYIVLEIDESTSGLSRDQLVQILTAENVLARRYFWPGCHRMEPYRSYFPNAGLLLPRTEEVARRVLLLPTGSTLGPSDVERICQLVRQAVAWAPAFRERLPEGAMESGVAVV